MAAITTDKTTTAYISVEIATDTYAKRSLRNINPAVTNVNLVDGLAAVAGLQSHTVHGYSRTDKYTVMADS